MKAKISTLFLLFAIAGGTLFQMGSCSTLLESFMQGFEMGYESETGESFFGSDDSYDDDYCDDWNYEDDD